MSAYAVPTPVAVRPLVGVIGGAAIDEEGYAAAREVGRLVAQSGAVLITGGLGGVMEAASRGCAEAGGLVVGILPGDRAEQANPFVAVPIVTNMGHARNVIIAQTAAVLIAVEGGYGTLSEMAVGLKLGRPVITLNSRFSVPGAQSAVTPAEAVRLALAGCAPAEGGVL